MSIDDWARTLWDYHHVGHALETADCIIALGSHDTRVAERAAELLLGGWAPLLVCSGHLGALTRNMWTRPEAEIFAEVAVARGAPRDDLSRLSAAKQGTGGDHRRRKAAAGKLLDQAAKSRREAGAKASR